MVMGGQEFLLVMKVGRVEEQRGHDHHAERRLLPAVLALMLIAEHQVPAREAHRHSRGAVVAIEVQDPRNAQGAADDRQRVVVLAHRQGAP